jgi:membrane-associated phospholipid phosphatase
MLQPIPDPFLALQHALAHPVLDPAMLVLSRACEGWAVALLGLVWIAFLERTRKGMTRALLPLAIALLVDGLVVQLVKHLWNVPRPLAVLGAEHIRLLAEPLRQHSMPSGHASAAALLAVYLTLRYGLRGAPLFLLALLGGVARVYVGAHWGRDVAVGWLIGAAVGFAAHAVALRLETRRGGAPRPLTERAAATPPSGSDPGRPGFLPSPAPRPPDRSGSRAAATPPAGASP